MHIFQRNILNKYIESLDVSKIQDLYLRYSDYFLNPDIQENIHQSKEEQFQEGFLRELFVKILGDDFKLQTVQTMGLVQLSRITRWCS